MLLQHALALSLVAISHASPIVLLRSEPPADAIFTPCHEGTEDPICHLVKQPSPDVITERVHPNGTVEVLKNHYTRAQLKAIRENNNVISVEHKPRRGGNDTSTAPGGSLAERWVMPPPQYCTSEIQKWYDTHEWGYWYQSWHQIGNCFYCDQCSEAISTSFGVAQTWTYGLSANFGDIISASFGFSWGQTFSLTDTRTCQWNFVESDCHSIWYQLS